MSYHHRNMENHTIFTKRVFEQLADLKLTSGQPKILEYLFDHDGAVQKEIAAACLIEPATVTSLLNRMEKQGLIIRRINEDNRRFWNVFLTREGKEDAGKVTLAFEEAEQLALKGFSPEETEALLGYLNRIHDNLSL